MKLANVLTASTLALAMASPLAISAETMSDAQKKDVEKVVHDYLVSNPEVLIEVSQALQQKQQKSMQDQAKSAVVENADALFGGKSTVVGNPKGNVTMVEFFDYQCVHCVKMASTVDGLIKKNPNLRVILVEFPIFGKNSEIASKAALAAGLQGKYTKMHDALFKAGKHLDEKIVLQAAKSAGLNVEKLKKDMESKDIAELLKANRELAEKMHLMGTPAFVIAATPDGKLDPKSEPAFVPGGATEEALQDLIKKAS